VGGLGLRLATRINGVVSEYSSFMVTFSFTASEPLAGIQIDVFYPVGKGSFVGSADGGECKLQADSGICVANDRDNGRLT
jgi:hypothetical protein